MTTGRSAEPQCEWWVTLSTEGFAKNEGKYIITMTFVDEINPQKRDNESLWWSRDRHGTGYQLCGTASYREIAEEVSSLAAPGRGLNHSSAMVGGEKWGSFLPPKIQIKNGAAAVYGCARKFQPRGKWENEGVLKV